MKTRIYAPIAELRPDFRLDAESRIRRKLRRWCHRLTQVRVFLRDENGPRGGFDKTCRLVLETRRGPSIVTQGRSHDADSALADALERARALVRRREDRRARVERARSRRGTLPSAA